MTSTGPTGARPVSGGCDPVLEVHATVHIDGPLFDRRASAIMRDLTGDCASAVAAQGRRDIHFTLGRVLRRPTGYYQSRIADRSFGAVHVLHDSKVIYGAWLEGVGSRNFPATRFKGYFTFRRVARALERKAVAICAPVVADHVRRLR
jgi:hypothetical protein